jgi:FlaA1/EpsC-like NDP-sugar epimerase
MLAGVNEDIALPILTQRPAIKPSAIPHASIQGRTVMVTGAGGSIGSELCKQIAASQPARMVLVDNSELNLYEINATLDNAKLPFERIPCIADVRDYDHMRYLFVHHGPDVVFHAAALKHVPLLENDHNLVEAVRTNVGGTKVIVDLCCSATTDLVLVSTDKAVNPSSVMGLTKRIAEIYAHAAATNHPKCRIRQVRFGNVLGSSGSVVPLFRRQIAHGGPVTVTHPEMTRYLMTIAEAVQLTLAASAIQHDGYGLYVLDMGEPVKIVDLAKKLIGLSGLRVDADIEIRFTGVRPGEKLFEELSYDWETLTPTSVPGVNMGKPAFNPVPLRRTIDKLVELANLRETCKVKHYMKQVVPMYSGNFLG